MQPVGVEVQTCGAAVVVQPGLQVTLAGRHDPSRQVTSHAHASPQLTAPHAPLPLQLTLHAPRPQPIELHDALPLQVTLHAPPPHVTVLQVWRPHAIVHVVALSQNTPLLHWLAIEHSTLQFQPVGQVTAWLQAPLLIAQSITQVFWAVLHDVHCDGHTAASPDGVSTAPESAGNTQNPSTQVRPSAQR